MRPVSIIGVGMIPFGKYPGKDTAELAGPAILEAMQDAGTERGDIGVVLLDLRLRLADPDPGGLDGSSPDLRAGRFRKSTPPLMR